MNYELKIRDPSSWTMLIFGIIALALGIIGLIQPKVLLNILNFAVISSTQRVAADYTIVFLSASSMASLNMGVYYILASLVDFKPFYWWTVPFRGLTFTVFTILVVRGIAPAGFILVGGWELVGAIATLIALLYESRNTQE